MIRTEIRLDGGDVARLDSWLQAIGKNVQPAAKKDAEQLASIYAEELLYSADRAGIQDFTGNLRNRLRSRPTIDEEGASLSLPSYMYPLSRMRPHWVGLHSDNAPIVEWMRKHRRDLARPTRGSKKKSIQKGSIHVSPHPFISSGERNARIRINHKIKSGELKIIKEVNR